MHTECQGGWKWDEEYAIAQFSKVMPQGKSNPIDERCSVLYMNHVDIVD